VLCAVVAVPTVEEARAQLARARQEGADLAEVRADALASADLEAIMRDRPLPVILTVRPAWEGGAFRGSEAQREALLRRGAALGAEYVDLEFAARLNLETPPGRRILSLHDFEGVPADLEPRLRRMLEAGPRWAKAAVTPRSTRELVDLVELQRRYAGRAAVVPMGPYAEPLRALYPMFGGPLMYASLDRSNAPGQLSLAEHRDLYRTGRIGPGTRALAVVGDPIAHSRSPERHNPEFARRGIDARLVRLKLDRAEALRGTMERLGLAAAAVTLPHKEALVPLLDEAPAGIGAVNTVWLAQGRFLGANTDLDGAREAIRGAEGPALVYGAGGAARAFVLALREAGLEVWVANRTRERAERLAAELGARAGDAVEARTVVNATRVGMTPREDESVVPPATLGPGVTAIDAVYTPPETRFLREARARGARVVPGTVMFEAQARAQFEIFARALS
jgi:3-dehydroquinate dehydratase/shikimate dehydrogenase